MKSDVVLDVGESYLTRLKYNVKKGKVGEMDALVLF